VLTGYFWVLLLEDDREKSVGSTTAIDQLIAAGMKEMNYLNAIMPVKYARNAEKLRAWMSASHIERAPQREKKPARCLRRRENKKMCSVEPVARPGSATGRTLQRKAAFGNEGRFFSLDRSGFTDDRPQIPPLKLLWNGV